ncbi:MAG: sigma-70 family RNA polymerase sigma factor [Prevotellaceae bacterium]|jgi:RNA polymerase sigma-70 factor (ECF subfamily)|nr:sigma-70 family RNA polymerase sigma factor [Prevotellaceae bacterium]
MAAQFPKGELLWIEQAKKGDQKAFRALMQRHHAGVFKQLKKRLGNNADAEDLAQLTFTKAFANIHTYNSDFAVFSTWLYTIANNCCIDFMRKRKNNLVSIDKMVENDEFNAQNTTPNPEESMIAEQNIALAKAVLDKLKLPYRTMVEMRYMNEFAYEEIAEKLNMPIGTVKTQLFRAKEQLIKLVLGNSGDKK